MNLFAVTSLLCGAFCAVLAVFSLLSGRTFAHRLLARFNVAVSFWGFGCFVAASAHSEQTALWGWKIAYLGGFFIAAIFYHLIIEFSKERRPVLLFIGYAQGIIFNLINFSSSMMMGEMRTAFGFFYMDRTVVMSLAVAFYCAYIFLSYYELMRDMKKSSGRNKTQARFIFFGFLAGFVGGTSILLPEFHIDLIYPAGNMGVFLYAVIVTYALLQHKLLNWEEVAEAVRRDKLIAMGMLTASINHEIRNPLFIIKGLADSFNDGVANQSWKSSQDLARASTEAMMKVEAQTSRAMDIIKKLTEFAKKDVSEKPVKESVHLKEVLEDVLVLLRHELSYQKIQLESRLPADLPQVQCDKRHLEEVLFNLIVNAIQAIKEGKGAGSIELSAERKEGVVCVSIKDNGPGIPAEQLKTLFEPFYTTKQEGTGLGLYITKQLIEQNGGKISVRSNEGSGTVFQLYLKS